MRTLISFLIGLLTAAAIVALGFVITQNAQSTQVSVQGTSLQASLGWMVAGAVVLGFVLAFLLLIPGRLASAFRSVGLSRQGRRLEEHLRGLREEYAQLQGSHQRLLDEHHRVLGQVLSPVAAGGREPALPPTLAMPAASVESLQRTGPILPPERAERPGVGTQPAQDQVSLLDHVRIRFATWKAQVQAWFQRQRNRAAGGSSGPTTPTTVMP